MRKWSKSNSRAFLDGKLAHANEVERSKNPYAGSDERLATQWDSGWLAHAQARKKLHGSSDDDTDASVPWRADTNSQPYRDGQLAHANEIERSKNPYAGSDDEMARQWSAAWDAHERARKGHGDNWGDSVGAHRVWPFEEFQTLKGSVERRLRSSLFNWGGLVAFIAGIALLSNQVVGGGFFAITLALCLILYPFVRFLFGGKDGVVPAITTAIVEEVLKHQIIKASDREPRRKRR